MSAVLYCRALEMGIDNCSLVGWVRSSVWSFSSAAWKDIKLNVCSKYAKAKNEPVLVCSVVFTLILENYL